MEKTITDQCVEVVLRKGQATIAEVIAVVGKHITSARAVARWKAKTPYLVKTGNRSINSKKDTPERMVYLGRYEIVANVLSYTVAKGRLRRVSRGVYAAPLPKVYQPSQAV